MINLHFKNTFFLAAGMLLLIQSGIVFQPAAEEQHSSQIPYTTDAQGNITSLHSPGNNKSSLLLTKENVPRLSMADQELVCNQPAEQYQQGETTGFLYSFSIPPIAFQVRYEISPYSCNGNTGWKQTITVIPKTKIDKDFTLLLPFAAGLPDTELIFFTPMKNGVGLSSGKEKQLPEWYYYMNGLQPKSEEGLLAIPMIEVSVKEEPGRNPIPRIVYCSDSYFSTRFLTAKAGMNAFQWNYEAAKIPLEKPLQRTFYTIVHSKDQEESLAVFYQTLGMPPGPAWLHDIALVGYDYLSDGGQGWFKDIDWLEQHLSPEERKQVCLTLHGWYDILGRYTFDIKKNMLDPEWTAFPNAPNCDKKVFPNSISVKMSQNEVLRRLRYAKERGFRVLLYFADGLAICEGAKEEFSREKILYSGGWQGPDTIGATHILNPLHPAVREWFLRYMDALLATYGKDVDGFVWDETFHADPSQYGTASAPGYASYGMMTLTRELTVAVHRFRPDAVFMASDCIGANGWYTKAPYSLMADGTYQDSHCQPKAWAYGIFPNYRNVLWSCNWNPITRFDWTETGVRRFQAPVVFTNGWNDDMGFYEMPKETADRFLFLFRERKQKPTQIKWMQ